VDGVMGTEQYVVELAIVNGVSGGYEFALKGHRDRGKMRLSNPDLAGIHREFLSLLRQNKPQRGDQPELAHEMFRLGHIEADRALALLKALRYHTIELEETSSGSKYEKIFELVEDRDAKLPWIVKVANASKTSLLESDPKASSKSSSSRKSTDGAPQLGGSHLHNTTTGAPEERLLLVYDRHDPEPLEELVNLLQAHIDVPAQQIVIEALVIEVNTSKLQDLGVEWSGSQGSGQASFERSSIFSGKRLGSFIFSRDGFGDFMDFRASIEALAERGDAEVLSSPSVLVLNDRQARIQVGRQIPIARTTATTSSVAKGIEYFPVGIVLNLRPRIDRENTEVTMQIETIISSISTESAARLEAGAGQGIEFSPIVDNRLVETYVRVADGTPFIIGGLLSTEQQQTKIGMPLLSSIPLLGRLVSRERVETEQREVIVVITPHIVPLEEMSFSYLIPKDSELFDRFDTKLFRNAYRVRDDDVWDLKFIAQSPVLEELVRTVQVQTRENVMLKRQSPFDELLSGRIPGEEVLVRRMLYEIVGKLNFHQEVNLDQVFFFTPPEDSRRGQSFSDDLTLQDLLPQALAAPENAVVFAYEARPQPREGQAFSLPLATVEETVLTGDKDELLWDLNTYSEHAQAEQWAVVLSDKEDVERLRKVLILKRVLSLNKNLEHTLQAFRPGVQILFPTREDMNNRYHLIDREVAQLF
ncbi:MAG: hypothetical protein VXW00_05270, partial [Candidatus Latescibacterota bacterium]|nr:hypothetical protein [Candidatus Latescibacterota bacterium]